VNVEEKQMEERIFCDYGIEVFLRDGKHYIRVDSGGIASRMIELEVSEEDAIRAQQNSEEAYYVILENQL
jgi:hypothetical protein